MSHPSSPVSRAQGDIGHWMGHIFPRDLCPHQGDKPVVPNASAPRCASAKAFAHLSARTPVPILKPKGIRGIISCFSHTIFWGVQGLSLLYPTLYTRSTSSLSRKRPRLGKSRVLEKAGGAESVPGIKEIWGEKSAPLFSEQSKTC